MSTSSPRAYPTQLAGGVCQWFGPRAVNRLAHKPPDLLGHFVTSTIIGPQNQAISVIAAYRPVQFGSGVNPVVQQHKRVLGPASNPCCQLLLDLATAILDLHQKGDEIILAIDANEELPLQRNVIWTDFEEFCVTTGLVDAMTALHGYATIPSCSRSSCTSSPIDFFCAHPLFFVISESACWTCCQVDLRITAPSSWMWTLPVFGSSPSRLLHRARHVASHPPTNTTPVLSSTSYMPSSMRPTSSKPSKQLKMRLPRNHWKNLQTKMERADKIMSMCMLEAQQAVLPSQRARSHPWSLALVQAQKKKGLTANLLALLTNKRPITPRIER